MSQIHATIVCPLCNNTLSFISEPNNHWHCDNKHNFDSAKQGYTHLLPVQHKKSKNPGDDATMVAARNRFLSQGYYQQVSDRINQIIIEYSQQQSITQPIIIDAGCGEGFYTSALQRALVDQDITADLTGVDISKFAVATAAKRNKAIRWFVANSSKLPIADHNAHTLLSLFSPLPAAEFHRALDKNGLLLVASTGNNHLIELREVLYDEVRENHFDPSQTLASHFIPLHETPIELTYTLQLNDTETIKDLFAMTPHYWRVSPKRQTLLDQLDQLAVSVDIQLHLFKPTDEITN